jgi:hypothetical protein
MNNTFNHLLRNASRTSRRFNALDAREVGPVAARYTSNAGQSIATGTTTVVNFEDKDFDTRDAATVGAGWQYAVPVAGHYQINARVTLDATTGWADGELLALDVYVNAAQKSRLFASEAHGSASSIEVSAQGGDLIHLDKGDVLSVRIRQNSGAARTLTADGAENYLTVHRVV